MYGPETRGRADFGHGRVSCPGIADGLEGCFPLQRLEVFGEVRHPGGPRTSPANAGGTDTSTKPGHWAGSSRRSCHRENGLLVDVLGVAGLAGTASSALAEPEGGPCDSRRSLRHAADLFSQVAGIPGGGDGPAFRPRPRHPDRDGQPCRIRGELASNGNERLQVGCCERAGRQIEIRGARRRSGTYADPTPTPSCCGSTSRNPFGRMSIGSKSPSRQNTMYYIV